MLNIVITDTGGKDSFFEYPVSVVINSDVNVPADDISVVLPYNGRVTKNADVITAICDGEVIFRGQIDEIINLSNEKSAVTKITARSFAGKLLDNEAEPVTYYCPASDFIFNRHLKPFGITGFEADSVPFYGYLKIDKGMTHWQVFRNFCMNRYGAVPRITGGGKALFKGSSADKKVIFGKENGSIDYCSIRENIKRYSLISEVRLKLGDMAPYDSHIRNGNPKCKNIERVRYVNAAADTSTITTADRIIENSNAKSYSVSLECTGCRAGIAGFSAEVNDGRLGKIDNLTVDRLKYSYGSGGEYTTVTLGRKESF